MRDHIMVLAHRDQTDKIHKALELSKEHLQLFSQDSPMHETKAGFAVEALDVLVQDLSNSETPSGKNEVTPSILSVSSAAML